MGVTRYYDGGEVVFKANLAADATHAATADAATRAGTASMADAATLAVKSGFAGWSGSSSNDVVTPSVMLVNPTAGEFYSSNYSLKTWTKTRIPEPGGNEFMSVSSSYSIDNSVHYANGSFYFCATRGSSSFFFKSTNGLNWSWSYGPAQAYPRVIYGGGKYLIPVTGKSAVSTDGVTWTLSSTIPGWNRDAGNTTYAGGRFFQGRQVSTDGLTWTTMTESLYTGSTYAYGNGVYIASSYNVVYSSTDTVTWTARSAGGAGELWRVVFGSGKFLLTYIHSASAKLSTDGVTWTTVTLPSVPYSMGSTGNMFVNIGSGGYRKTYVSTDGVTWTTVTLANAPNGQYYFTADTGGMTFNADSTPALGPARLSYSTLSGELPATITGTTYSVADNDKWLTINSTGNCVVTLPSAVYNQNRELVIKQLAAYTVTSSTASVAPLGSSTPGTAILSGAGKYAKLVSDGTSWVTMEAN